MKVRVGLMAMLPVFALFLMMGCATTQDEKAKAETAALCSALDVNHNGKISKEEFMARSTDKNKALEVYNKCDTGKKGYLTYDEIMSNRVILPPDIYMNPPPLVRPMR
jgi:Ca2+-binding EF-hand superfamily protein